VIVSDVPGTTRDAVDVLVQKGEDRFLLIDTAGMRRRGRVEQPVERYSVLRALRAVDRAQVVLLVIDATEGVTEQDQRIAGYAHEAGKACIVVVNKWDLVQKDDRTMDLYREKVKERLAFMDYAMVAFLSAKTRARVHRLLPMIRKAAENHARRIGTAELNHLIREAYNLNPPPSDKGRRLKIYFVTQPQASPPSFVFFVNDPELVHFSYKRYLENQLRQAYDFEGTPIRLYFRSKGKVDESERPVPVRRVLPTGKVRVIRRAPQKRGTE